MILPRFPFSRRGPTVRVLDTMSDDTNATTYTFANRSLGSFGAPYPSHAEDIIEVCSLQSPQSRKIVAAIVHGEDLQLSYNVSSVSIGGVAGTERVDRGGTTNLINTAIYTWQSSQLADIANSNVVVTWSESIINCAVGIVEIGGIFDPSSIASSSATGTGTMNPFLSSGFDSQNCFGGLALIGTSCVTGGGTEHPIFETLNVSPGEANAGYSPILLYHGSSAELDFAAAAIRVKPTRLYQASTSFQDVALDWSGSGAADVAAVFFT